VLAVLVIASVTGANGYGYTKPVTYNEGNVVFKDRYLESPHSWIIVKAVDLIRHDGYSQEADVAQKYLLPMMEGVTYNDVWGDADLAGGSILDYYIPGSPGTNFGYGCAGILGIFAYKNCTQDFQSNGFYGYGNAADEAQYRYDYAKRIVLGNWGADSRDRSAAWVTDTLFGQDDPMDGNWGTDTAQIDAGGYSGTSFGSGQTPASSMLYLLQHGTNAQVVFPAQSDPALSTIYVPTYDVVDNHGPGWLDDTFGGADDVEAFNGYDGHGYAVYSNWTPDTGSGCSDTCNAAPMVVRLPVGSTAHAFFNLGWSIHLLEDQTTPVHTSNDSYTTAEVHNDIEKRADEVLNPPYVSYNGQDIKDELPALDLASFQSLYPFPPSNCADKVHNPAPDFKSRWYTSTLSHPGEGVAHAYVRQTAEITHAHLPYIECINTEDNKSWSDVGYFTSYGLDLGIKSAAGLIRQFIEDVDHTAPTLAIVQPAATTYPHSATITLNYSATDDLSGVKSLTATLDGQTTVGVPPHGLASGQKIVLLTEVPTLGHHTFTITATDYAGNTSTRSVTFTINVTPTSIQDDVSYFVSTGAITQGEGFSLLQRLKAAAALRAVGGCTAANLARSKATYQAFINEVNAQTGKTITAAAAAILISDAQYLMTQCP
jgi:hypothetical protein